MATLEPGVEVSGRTALRRLRRAMVAIIGGFILFAPALPQVFGVQSPFCRPWIMYSGVAMGLLKGEFSLAKPDDSTETFAPLDVLGLERYPWRAGSGQPHQVDTVDDLSRAASRFCGTLRNGERLSFRGWMSTQRGWEPIEAVDICGAG